MIWNFIKNALYSLQLRFIYFFIIYFILGLPVRLDSQFIITNPTVIKRVINYCIFL